MLARHLDDESKALVTYELVGDIHEIRESLARSLDYLKKPIDRVLKAAADKPDA